MNIDWKVDIIPTLSVGIFFIRYYFLNANSILPYLRRSVRRTEGVNPPLIITSLIRKIPRGAYLSADRVRSLRDGGANPPLILGEVSSLRDGGV